jgi:hypothetical protein
LVLGATSCTKILFALKPAVDTGIAAGQQNPKSLAAAVFPARPMSGEFRQNDAGYHKPDKIY